MREGAAARAPRPETPGARTEAVCEVVRDLVVELQPRRGQRIAIGPASALDDDLGLDSLARAELIHRLERRFDAHLPAELSGEAETVADLESALERAGAARPVQRAEKRRSSPEEAAAAPAEARTLPAVLEWRARQHPERVHAFLYEGPGQESELSYGELVEQSRAAARGLRRWGVEPGQRVAIMLPTGFDFFRTFFGVLMAGAVPVPIYPPARPSQLEQHMRRQAGILDNAQAVLLIAPEEGVRLGHLLTGSVSSLKGVETVQKLARQAGEGEPLPSIGDPDATALIQYTSGSTGSPKGVVLSHANLLTNIRAMGEAMEAGPTDVFVSWLPLYHDMGLIGAWLGSLYYAAPLVIMSPVTFLAHPAEWLWAIHRHRATLSVAPNFAFEICARRLDDAELEGLDLSSLRMVANGAEPVSPRTIRRFTERFSPYGFRAEAMAPVYGLAECAVGLAFPPLDREPVIDRIDRIALSRHGRAEPAADDSDSALEVVACGRALPGHEFRIVDDAGRELPERREGRLQFRGPSATRGYFRNEAQTRALFDNDWLESGDKAYIAGGDVFFTGREKDIIIRGGRNIYPQEVEDAVGEVEGIRKGCVAVFGAPDLEQQTERLVVLAETRETDSGELEALRQAVSEAAAAVLEAPPDDVALVEPHTVPKTSSGKIRRAAAREVYESGGARRAGALWLQVTRLWFAGLGPRLAAWRREAAALAYAGWWWLALMAVAVAVWPAVQLLPGRARRWRLVHGAARTVLRLTGTRLEVRDETALPEGGAVVVCNHSSYLDSLVLAAVLPGPLGFVAKRELEPQRVAGRFLRRLGTQFVERWDARAGQADTERTVAALQHGERLVVFPEGTLQRAPGLMPFHLGAFVAAAQAGVPVQPMALRGTRSILRGGSWFPRAGRVSLAFGPPQRPEGTDFDAALRLRDAARAWMLEACGEPDLAG